MEKKLTWQEIEKLYNQEWVELVECEWPDEEINPRSGIVRVHAKTHEEFHDLVAKLPPVDSTFVFVGEPDIPPNVIVGSRQTIKVTPINA